METKSILSAFAALAHDTRLAIFRHLVQAGPQGACVGTIGDALDVVPATLSFHLKELSHADLVDSRQDGRFIWYAANFATMNGLIAYLTENCCGGRPRLCATERAPAKYKSSRRRVAR